MKSIKLFSANLIKNIRILNKFYWHLVIKQKISYTLKDFIFISSMPKSASTFLFEILRKATGYRRAKLYFAPDNEKDLYLPYLIKYANQFTITQTHMRLTATNLNILKYFSIRPVILVRNIYDVVPSVRNHFYKEPSLDKIFINTWRMSITDQFFKLSEEHQYDFIIDFVVPWYIDFFVSWYYAEKENAIELLWITYENLVTKTSENIKKIMEYYGIDKADEEIQHAINISKNRNTRFNKGIIGLGQEMLTKDQRERILKFTTYYPDVNFSLVGL